MKKYLYSLWCNCKLSELWKAKFLRINLYGHDNGRFGNLAGQLKFESEGSEWQYSKSKMLFHFVSIRQDNLCLSLQVGPKEVKIGVK